MKRDIGKNIRGLDYSHHPSCPDTLHQDILGERMSVFVKIRSSCSSALCPVCVNRFFMTYGENGVCAMRAGYLSARRRTCESLTCFIEPIKEAGKPSRITKTTEAVL